MLRNDALSEIPGLRKRHRFHNSAASTLLVQGSQVATKWLVNLCLTLLSLYVASRTCFYIWKPQVISLPILSQDSLPSFKLIPRDPGTIKEHMEYSANPTVSVTLNLSAFYNIKLTRWHTLIEILLTGLCAWFQEWSVESIHNGKKRFFLDWRGGTMSIVTV